MNLQSTVDRMLAHSAICVRCKNNPFDLCKEGQFLLDAIGVEMPTSPVIRMEVKYRPDEIAEREGKRAETVRGSARIPNGIY